MCKVWNHKDTSKGLRKLIKSFYKSVYMRISIIPLLKNRSRIYTSHHFHLNAQSSHLIAFLEEGNVSVCSLRSYICLVKKLFSNKDFYYKIWYEYYHHKITNNFITNLRHSKDVNVWRNELQYYFFSKLFFFQTFDPVNCRH